VHAQIPAKLLSVDREQYRLAICDALQTAGSIPFRKVTFRDGSAPQRNKCHENVAQFVSENPGHKAIRGWICIDKWIRDAHSIVEGPAGERFDITPFEPECCRSATSFAEHIGDEETFQQEREYQGQFYCTCRRHPEIELTGEPAPLVDADDPWSGDDLSDWP
jgi:hypothetical protein